MNDNPFGTGTFVQGAMPGYAQPKTTSKKKKKGFWEDQISTGGSMAGAGAGAAAGAALGSVVPGLGTAIGGLLGAIIGGAGGGGAGQILENKLTGEQNLLNDVGSEMLWGGVTPVGPIKALSIGKGLATGTKAALQGGGGAALKQAVEKGITATPIRTALSGIGKSASKTGDQLIASQSGLTMSQARNMKLNPVQTFGNINNRTGLTSLDDMAEFGKKLTGGNDSLLDTMTYAAVGDAKNIAIPDLRKTATALIADQGALLSDSQRKNLINHVKNASVAMYGGSKGSIATGADSLKALKQANNFRAIAKDATNGFNVTPDNKQLGNIYSSMAKQIEDSIYSAPGTSANWGAIAKSGSDDLLFIADDLAKQGKKAQSEAAKKLAAEVSQSKSVADLRKLKKDFVDISKIDTATAQAQGARTLGGQDLSKQAGDMLRNPMNILAKPLDAKSADLGGLLKSVSGKLPTAGAGSGITPLSAAMRAGGYQALFNAEDNSSLDPQYDEATGDQMTMQDLPATPTQEQAPTNPLGYSSTEIAQALMKAIAAGDSTAASQLKQMYELASQFETADAAPQMSAASTKAVTQAANGEAAINELETLLAQAGGGSGALGGRVQGLLGAVDLDQNAKLYNDSLGGYVDLIAKARGKTDALSEADRELIMNSLPRITDTKENAARKIAALRRSMQVARQNALLYGGGADEPMVQAGY